MDIKIFLKTEIQQTYELHRKDKIQLHKAKTNLEKVRFKLHPRNL